MEFLIALIGLGIYLVLKLAPMRMEVLKNEKEDIIETKNYIKDDVKLLHREVQTTSAFVIKFFTNEMKFDEFIIKLKEVADVNLEMIKTHKVIIEGESRNYTNVKHSEMAKKSINLLESSLEYRELLLKIQWGLMKGLSEDDKELVEVSKNALVGLLKEIDYIAEQLGLESA